MALLTGVLQLPIKQSSYTLTRTTNNIVSKSPYTFQSQVIQGQGECWNLNLAFVPATTTEQTLALGAFLSALNGQLRCFEFFVPQKDLKYGSGQVTVTSTAIGNVIDVSNTSPLYVGSFITMQGMLHQIVAKSSNQIEIFPRLRYQALNNIVNYTTPSGLFKLKSNSVGSTFNLDHTRTATLEAEEFVW